MERESDVIKSVAMGYSKIGLELGLGKSGEVGKGTSSYNSFLFTATLAVAWLVLEGKSD